MNGMTSPAASRSRWPALLVFAAVLALVAYFLVGRRTPGAPAAAPAAAIEQPAVHAPVVTANGLPPGARDLGDGVIVDENGARILNSAGLPLGPPLDPAKAIPVKAAPTDVVGYAKDANGVSKPLRAEDLRGRAANTPGTYAVVDMWADGGPTVVQATEGHHLSERELAASRAAEASRDRAAQQR